LSLAVDDITQATLSKKGDTPESFCAALHTSFQSEGEDGQGSLAWNAKSYTSLLDDAGTGLSGAQASLYLRTKPAIVASSDALENLKTSGDVQTGIELTVTIRSALIEMGNEFKKTNGPNPSRLDALASFLDGAVTCLSTSVDASSADDFSKMKENIGTVTALWEHNKSIFSQPETAAVNDTFSVSAASAKSTTTDSSTLSIDDAAQVATAGDLQIFAKTIAKKYPSIKAVMSSSGNLTLQYKSPAKLFGIFNTGLSRKVTYNADGMVTTSLPWYKIFFYKKAPEVSAISEKTGGNKSGKKDSHNPETDDKGNVVFHARILACHMKKCSEHYLTKN
jgi:hypothetical protein